MFKGSSLPLFPSSQSSINCLLDVLLTGMMVVGYYSLVVIWLWGEGNTIRLTHTTADNNYNSSDILYMYIIKFMLPFRCTHGT